VIEGITPHKGKLSFLFPPDVGTERQRWGFFNRLRYLGKTDAQILAEEKSQQEKPKKAFDVRMGNRPSRKEPNQPPPMVAKTTPKGVVPSPTDKADANKQAEALPFETYFDPGAETVESYFDISRRGWLSAAPDNKSQPLPGELGILREEKEETKPGITHTSSSTPQPDVIAKRRAFQSLPVYLDCVTLEPITDTYELDEDGEIKLDGNNQPIIQHHDYWFQVRFKVKLKESNSG